MLVLGLDSPLSILPLKVPPVIIPIKFLTLVSLSVLTVDIQYYIHSYSIHTIYLYTKVYSVTLVLFVLGMDTTMYPLYCWYEQQQAIRSTLSTRSYAIGASNV